MPAPTTRRPVVKRRLLKDEAHDAIQAAILDGTFAPGEKLDDHALTQWLGISRSPIREALNLLASEGFVEIQAQSSTSVVSPDPEQVEQDAQAYGAVVGGVLRLTLPALSAAERAEGVALIDGCLAAVQRRDRRGYIEAAGVHFFEFLLGHCPNRVVAGIARGAVPSLVFRIRIASELRIPNGELLRSGWTRMRDAFETADLMLADRSFAELYRMPVPGVEWTPARWETPAK